MVFHRRTFAKIKELAATTPIAKIIRREPIKRLPSKVTFGLLPGFAKAGQLGKPLISKAITKAAPFGRALGKQVSKVSSAIGQRFLDKPFKTTAAALGGILVAGALKESPFLRKQIKPTTAFRRGEALGEAIETISDPTKRAAALESGELQEILKKAGLIGGIAAAVIGAAALVKAREERRAAAPITAPVITPQPFAVTPITPGTQPFIKDIPVEEIEKMPEEAESEKLIRQQIPQIKLTANPKINVVIQNSIT